MRGQLRADTWRGTITISETAASQREASSCCSGAKVQHVYRFAGGGFLVLLQLFSAAYSPLRTILKLILRLFSAFESCRAWRAAQPRRRRAQASEEDARYRGERSFQAARSCLVCTRDARELRASKARAPIDELRSARTWPVAAGQQSPARFAVLCSLIRHVA